MIGTSIYYPPGIAMEFGSALMHVISSLSPLVLVDGFPLPESYDPTCLPAAAAEGLMNTSSSPLEYLKILHLINTSPFFHIDLG